MKLKTFNRLNSSTVSTPKISFRKSGIISLNRTAALRMDLSVGDSILFVQDEDSPKDWYIIKCKCDKDGGFILKEAKHDSLMTSSKTITESVLSSIGMETTGTMVISPDPIENEFGSLWGIITRSAKSSNR